MFRNINELLNTAKKEAEKKQDSFFKIGTNEKKTEFKFERSLKEQNSNDAFIVVNQAKPNIKYLLKNADDFDHLFHHTEVYKEVLKNESNFKKLIEILIDFLNDQDQEKEANEIESRYRSLEDVLDNPDYLIKKLRYIAVEGKQTPALDPDYLINPLKDIYNFEDYELTKEIFCGELIRLMAPNSAAKHRKFASSSRVFVGIKFFEDFQNWDQAFNPKEMKINDEKITSDGCVQAANGETRLVTGLGIGAVLRYLIGLEDTHSKNWGLRNLTTEYQVLHIDLARSLGNLRFASKNGDKQREIQEEKNLIIKNVTHILKLVYEIEYCHAPKHLAPQFFNSQFIRNEIEEAMETVVKFPFHKIEELADLRFANYPIHKKLILEEIKAGIQFFAEILAAIKTPRHLSEISEASSAMEMGESNTIEQVRTYPQDTSLAYAPYRCKLRSGENFSDFQRRKQSAPNSEFTNSELYEIDDDSYPNKRAKRG